MSNSFKFKKSIKSAILASACVVNLGFAFIGQAEETKAKEVPTWKSKIEFGYVSTSGNSESTNLNGLFATAYEVEKWKHAVSLTSFFSEATDSETDIETTSAERYAFQGKTDYKFSEDGYAFGVLDYGADRFSDNDYITSLTFGRGFKFTPSETSKLDLELGLGYRQTKKRETLTIPSVKINEMVVRLAANYTLDITEHSKFEQKFSMDIGEESTVTQSYTALSANVAENLALKLSLTATHQSEVSPGFEALDTITAVSIVYNF